MVVGASLTGPVTPGRGIDIHKSKVGARCLPCLSCASRIPLMRARPCHPMEWPLAFTESEFHILPQKLVGLAPKCTRRFSGAQTRARRPGETAAPAVAFPSPLAALSTLNCRVRITNQLNSCAREFLRASDVHLQLVAVCIRLGVQLQLQCKLPYSRLI